jgi:hypothetical protein
MQNIVSMKINGALIIFLIFFCIKGKSDEFPPPPGTKAIEKNLFIDKETITVADWKEFIYSQKFKNLSDSVLCLNLDTALYFNIYNKAPIDDLPIIGKTIGEINEYCLWRSKMVNALIYQTSPNCSKRYWKKCEGIREQKLKVKYFIYNNNEHSKNYDITNQEIKSDSLFFEKTYLPVVCYSKYQ